MLDSARAARADSVTISQPAPETPLERHRFHVLAGICVAVAVGSLVLEVLKHGWGGFGRVWAVAASAQLAGKSLVFVGAKANNPYGFGPWAIAYITLMLDVLLALVLNTFLPQIERMPGIGPWLVKTRLKADAAYSQYPKLRKMAWTGVAVWVFLPLPASGAVTGSFASRLAGLSRTQAVTAISVGSAATGVIFAALAAWIGAEADALLKNWKVTAACSVVVIVLLWIGWRRLVKHLRTEA